MSKKKEKILFCLAKDKFKVIDFRYKFPNNIVRFGYRLKVTDQRIFLKCSYKDTKFKDLDISFKKITSINYVSGSSTTVGRSSYLFIDFFQWLLTRGVMISYLENSKVQEVEISSWSIADMKKLYNIVKPFIY